MIEIGTEVRYESKTFSGIGVVVGDYHLGALTVVRFSNKPPWPEPRVKDLKKGFDPDYCWLLLEDDLEIVDTSFD